LDKTAPATPSRNWNQPNKLAMTMDYSSNELSPGSNVRCARSLSKCSNFKSRYRPCDNDLPITGTNGPERPVGDQKLNQNRLS
jgi:hypothetical protein